MTNPMLIVLMDQIDPDQLLFTSWLVLFLLELSILLIKQNPTKGSFKFSISTCKLSTLKGRDVA
jgi:hypothetical protein